MKQDTKVFIVNRGGHDYSGAKEFGELIFCTEGSLDKYEINQMYRELNDAMEGSSAEDFILLTSLHTLCGIACGIFSSKHHKLNLLLFKKGKYLPRTITFDKE